MYVPAINGRIRQGDIYGKVLVKDAYDTSIGDITYDFVIVLSQDCDLLQDFRARKMLAEYQGEGDQSTDPKKLPDNDKFVQNVLVCPAFVAETLRLGEHLASANMKMQTIHSDRWKPLMQNDSPRYHYLEANEEYGIPNLVVDFKLRLALPVEYLNNQSSSRIARLEELYAHDLALRHSNYSSRIALPDELEED